MQQDMRKRAGLIRAIKLMFTALLLALVFVLLRSIGGSSNFSQADQLFDDVVTGQTTMRRIGSTRVWVTRLSNQQRAQAEQLNGFLVDSSAGCAAAQDVCVLSTATSVSGIEQVFSLAVPASLDSAIPWFGGFVDPTNGAVFDRLGRAYKGNKDGRAALALVKTK